LIIREIKRFPRNPLFVVQFFFQFEHEFVEELLQSLIRIIDTQLFEGVDLEEGEKGKIP
jgi:hypothetical protein